MCCYIDPWKNRWMENKNCEKGNFLSHFLNCETETKSRKKRNDQVFRCVFESGERDFCGVFSAGESDPVAQRAISLDTVNLSCAQ